MNTEGQPVPEQVGRIQEKISASTKRFHPERFQEFCGLLLIWATFYMRRPPMITLCRHELSTVFVPLKTCYCKQMHLDNKDKKCFGCEYKRE